MTDREYNLLMLHDGYEDGVHGLPPKYADEIPYAIGYAEGEVNNRG